MSYKGGQILFDLIDELIPDKVKTIFYMMLYSYLSYKINYNFSYSNILEYSVGTILVAISMIFTDFIIRNIAYHLTGLTITKANQNINEKKACHWMFRVLALITIIPLAVFTQIPNMIISYFVPPIANLIILIFKNWQTEFSNQIIETITK